LFAFPHDHTIKVLLIPNRSSNLSFIICLGMFLLDEKFEATVILTDIGLAGASVV
jgi:hypothetical protein